MRRSLRFIAMLTALLAAGCGGDEQFGTGGGGGGGTAPTSGDWVAAMQDVHVIGVANGVVSGSVTQFGDSITYSMAFLAGMKWGEPSGSDWQTLRDGVDVDLIYARKGTSHGNYSGWTAANGAAVVDAVLAAHDPEMALIMFGTNDVKNGVAIATYESNLRAIVDACLAYGTVPIISTIPPTDKKPLSTVQAFNDVVREIAAEKHLPLIDYYDAILSRRPGTDWNGTLISGDGVHPSNPSGSDLWDFTAGNLDDNGYALRNYLSCVAMQEVIEQVFGSGG